MMLRSANPLPTVNLPLMSKGDNGGPVTSRVHAVSMSITRREVLGALTLLGASWLQPVPARAADFDLARYRGQPVYLDFWASWCGPCLQSMPWLAQLHEQYADQGLVIVAVNLDRDREAADRFLRRVPVPFPIVYDPKGELAERFGVSGMPHSFLFARDGTRLADHIGFLASEKAMREAQIRQALAA